MAKRLLCGICVSVVAATWLSAQPPQPPPQGGAAGAGGRGGGQAGGGRGAGGGGGGGSHYPTTEQWTNMSPAAKAFVDKATALAGTDPDLKFDQSIFCQADG